MDKWNKKYPDTPEGVRQMMADNSDISAKNLAKARLTKDPWVDGVWKFTWDKPVGGVKAAIAYMAGYKEVGGRVRTENDFETEESFDD